MKNIMKLSYCLALGYLLISCDKKIKTNPVNPGDLEPGIDYTDTTINLKDAANFPIGASVSYAHLNEDLILKNLLYSNFDELVFNSELKHGAITKGDGEFDYSTADAFVALAQDMDVYGHVLAWHRHQNTTYLNSLVGNFEKTELLTNPGFEKEDLLNGQHWNVLNSGNPRGESTISITSNTEDVRSGLKALKVVNPTSYGTSDWRVQVASHTFNTVPGAKYQISYSAKSLEDNGIIMVSAQAMNGSNVTHYPGGDKTIRTSYQTVVLSFTATQDKYRIVFNLGKKANTYLIDDASVFSEVAVPDYDLIYSKLDGALNNFVTTTVTRYKDKIRSWEVVNEMFTDQGEIRNANNSQAPIVNGQKEYGYFVWSEYLKRDYGYLAFKYAEMADPTAELYINDYGLEYSDKKIDSLISYVNEIRKRGAKVDGIGTQMHIDIYLSRAKMDKMFQKLASTGLKIRVSELDIRITNSTDPVTPTPDQWLKQREQYKNVVESYVRFVPKAQRAGICVWSVVDKYNWQYHNGADFPNLFDVDYKKKEAYGGFLNGLAGQ